MKKIYRSLIGIMVVLMLVACGKSAEQQILEQLELGQKYLTELNYEEAIVIFSKVIELDEKNTKAYFGRGQAYVLSGETAENLALALADFEKVLALDETIAEAWLGKVDILIRQGAYEDALELLRGAMEKTGGNLLISEKIEEMESGIYVDSSGQMRRENHYDADGSLIWYHTFTYNADGSMASVTSYDANSNQTGHIDLEYENGHELVGYSVFLDDGQLNRGEFLYDANGRRTEEKWYYGNEIERCVLLYNDAGIQIGEETYDSNGQISDSTEYVLNEDGKVIEKYRYFYWDGQKKLSGYDVFEYNNKGLRTAQYSYDEEGTLLKNYS